MTYRTLLFLLLTLLSIGCFAQVGVNNSNPEQALDVNGKVKLGNDGTNPSDGTMRYNSTEGTFEGFSQGEWKSLDAQGATPDQPTPFFASVYTTFQSEEFIPMEFQTAYGQSAFFFENQGDPSFFTRTVIPAGYMMVVDYIHVVGMSTSNDEQFLVHIAATDGDATNATERSSRRDEPLIYVSGSIKGGPAILGNGRAPLLVVDAGEQLTLRNESASTSVGGVRVVFTGFLVTDLDQYFTY
ncbi:hypothetical protein [Lewinella sp. 4G2]|uniref:hypothetical protein n=1 Tax=Lewinella sp. 4G2 TaxID=1803372 RepID=UPI0012FA181B|nr:hypothetical protein [Lewinella sp. 4G2]